MLLSQLLWPTLKLKLPLERGSFHKTGSFLGGATRPEKQRETGLWTQKGRNSTTSRRHCAALSHLMLLLMGDDGWCLVPAHPFCNRKQNGSQLLTILHCGWSKKLMIFFRWFQRRRYAEKYRIRDHSTRSLVGSVLLVCLCVCLCVCKPVFCKANSNVSSCSCVYQQLYPLYQHFWAARATPNPYCPRQPNANDAGAQSVTDSHPTANQPPPTSHHPQPAAPLPSLMHPPFTLQIWLFSQQRIQTNHWF